MIIFYCRSCGKKGEFAKKKDMRCGCGNYINKRNNASDRINMRTTWSGTTKIEFSNTTIEKDIASRNNR